MSNSLSPLSFSSNRRLFSLLLCLSNTRPLTLFLAKSGCCLSRISAEISRLSNAYVRTSIKCSVSYYARVLITFLSVAPYLRPLFSETFNSEQCVNVRVPQLIRALPFLTLNKSRFDLFRLILLGLFLSRSLDVSCVSFLNLNIYPSLPIRIHE